MSSVFFLKKHIENTQQQNEFLYWLKKTADASMTLTIARIFSKPMLIDPDGFELKSELPQVLMSDNLEHYPLTS